MLDCSCVTFIFVEETSKPRENKSVNICTLKMFISDFRPNIKFTLLLPKFVFIYLIFVKKICVKIHFFSTSFGRIRPIAGGKLLAAANQRKAAQIDQWPEHISKCFVLDGGSANGIKVLLLLYNFISQDNKKVQLGALFTWNDSLTLS